MDSLITAAARALAAGHPLGALKRVALRDDAPGLALRGIAMAQLGDHVRAKALLRRAARAFGPKEAVARARCVVAEASLEGREVIAVFEGRADPKPSYMMWLEWRDCRISFIHHYRYVRAVLAHARVWRAAG